MLYVNRFVVGFWDRDIGVVERGRLCGRGDIWGLEKRAIAVDAAEVD